MKLIIASNNEGKISEYRNILVPLKIEVTSLKEQHLFVDVQETGSTFEENAILKARAIYNIANCPVIADDSGLEVEALHGEPGIYSARYKGLNSMHDKRIAVLEALNNEANRKAKFVTCICYIDSSGKQNIFTGIWNGTIAYTEQGLNGFGYDSIFIPEESDNLTVASLPVSFKETHSHRAKAVSKLLQYLELRNL